MGVLARKIALSPLFKRGLSAIYEQAHQTAALTTASDFA